MRLDEVIHRVADKPGSTKERTLLASALQHFQVPGAVKVWETTAFVAAAKGDFFNALSLIRLHLPGSLQGPLLENMVEHYLASPQPHDPPQPNTPQPINVQLPRAPKALLQTALQLGTSREGIYLSPHLKLPEFPIFGDLPQDLLLLLLQNMVPVPLKDGELLLRQGTKERACYFLTHGRLRVMKEATNQSPKELARLSAPTLIGEISLLTTVSRRATILADGPGLAWRIDAQLLEHLGKAQTTLLPQIRTMIRMRLVMNLMKAGEIFPKLNETERFELLQAFNMHVIEPNREIIRIHERVPGLFVNMHGEVVVHIQMGNGRMKEVTRLTEGSVFGGPSFFSGTPSRTTITMPEGGLLLQLTPQAYQQICQRYPHMDEQLRQQKYPY